MQRFAVMLIITAAFLSACAGTGWVRTPVAKQHEFAVSMEQPRGNGAVVPQQKVPANDIALSAMKKLLGDLKYLEKEGLTSKSKPKPVFQEAEIERLAPVLTEELAKADTSQRVRFISFNQAQGVLFSHSQKTEGVVFFASDGRLNIAFNYINFNRLPSETSAIYSSYTEDDPLKVRVSDTPIAAVAPYAELRKFENGAQAPMWVMADLKQLEEAVSTAAAPVVKAPEKAAPAAPYQAVAPAAPPQAVAPAAPPQAGAPAASPQAGAAGTPAEKTAPPHAADDSLEKDIKNKLKYLKELRDEGLISEQDYTAKKMELLNKIK